MEMVSMLEMVCECVGGGECVVLTKRTWDGMGVEFFFFLNKKKSLDD